MTSAANPVDLPLSGWRLVTDSVMGGVSQGTMTQSEVAGRPCIALRGDVSTENNGGFLQITFDLEGSLRDASALSGVKLEVAGNNEAYNVHLRTSKLWLPWQSYRATFTASPEWTTVTIPFSSLKPYRTTTPLHLDKLRRIGLVAIGRDFTADLCVGRASFY